MSVDKSKPEKTIADISLEDDDGKKKSRATVLIEIGSTLKLFHCKDSHAYAELKVGKHVEIRSLETKAFREWLSHQYFKLTGVGADRGSLMDAVSTLSSMAKYDRKQRATFLRVAQVKDTIYIDLCDKKWRVIEVTATGWQILERSPVAFIRSSGMAALPVPDANGDISLLWVLLNIKKAHRPLVLAFLVAALRMHGPFPILVLLGEQGTAKSSVCRVLRYLTDPSTVPLRAPPTDNRDFMVSAMNNWMIIMDNLSLIKPWLSDVLCRISTGGGHSARELYSDTDEVLRELQRPSILNGLDDVATRPDFADRALLLHLVPISRKARMTERHFKQVLTQHAPKIMGALLDRVSAALRNIDSIHLEELPRMGDFLEWAVAAEDGEGLIEAAYLDNQENLVMTGLEASPVARTLMVMMGAVDGDGMGEWEGSATELLHELGMHMMDEETKKSKAWPKSATWLSNTLRRIGSPLRSVGIDVQLPHQTKDRKVHILNYRKSADIETLPQTEPDQPGDSIINTGKPADIETLPQKAGAMRQKQQKKESLERTPASLIDDDAMWPENFTDTSN